MTKDCRVYISSTFTDLEEHRKAVYALLSKLESVEVVAMEDHVATDARAVDKCLADVARCDVYVGLFAWRYGFVPPAKHNPAGTSITELEFRKAKAKGKHCLIFVLDADAQWKRRFMDEVTGDSGGGACCQDEQHGLAAGPPRGGAAV